MPTFFSPGGRTFAGGDMMPCVIPCPKAHAARSRIAIIVRIVLILLNADLSLLFLFVELQPWHSGFRPHGRRSPLARNPLAKPLASRVARANPSRGQSGYGLRRSSGRPSHNFPELRSLFSVLPCTASARCAQALALETSAAPDPESVYSSSSADRRPSWPPSDSPPADASGRSCRGTGTCRSG